MNKLPIALLALGVGFGLSSTPVRAQSSLTLSGVVDVGVGKVRLEGDKRPHMISGSFMNVGNSYIGVHGVGDLGGQMKVGLDLETAMSLRDGSWLGSGGGFWGRRANMWISGSAGSLRLGRQYNLATWSMWVWELTGEATYAVVPDTFRYVDSFSSRSNSQITYTTPMLGEFQGGVAYVFGDDNDPMDKGHHRIDSYLTWEHGPISIGANVNKTSGRKTNYQIGGRYEWSRFALAASWTDVRHIRDGSVTGQRSGYSLGGQLRMAPFRLTLDMTRDTKNEWSGGRKYTNYLAEGRYPLSKSTQLYAAFLRYDGLNNWGVGIRHTF